MGLEQPLIGAAIARLPEPTVHLAALGGIVFPFALAIESPIVMLLAASTALGDHKQAYTLMYRFMMIAGGLLTGLHALLAFIPLYDLFIVAALAPPEAIVEPARWGLRALLPWTWSIAHRRFHQGLLIRYGDARAISVGTLLRLLANSLSMTVTILLGLPGIVVAGLGISAGVVAEAVFVALRARPIVRDRLPDTLDEPLSWRSFGTFYTPLAFTTILLLGSQPIGSAAISRMPEALNSLAVWPVLVAFIFLFRGLGFAFNEVVVTALKEQIGFGELTRFAHLLSLALTGMLGLVALTPLSRAYFAGVAGLNETLTPLAVAAFVYALFWPALSVYRNLYQGVIVFSGQTRFVSEAVVASLLTTTALLFAGVALNTYAGLFVGVVAFLAGTVVQVLWLFWRSRSIRKTLGRAEQLEPAPAL